MITELLLLALVAEPPPQKPVGIVAGADYPTGALMRGEQGSVYFQLIVSPEGRVDSCTILISSGFKNLDDATCLLVTSRARFSPAQDDNGRPIYGTYRQLINWRIAGLAAPPQKAITPDVELTINRAPPGTKLPLQFTIRYFINAKGTTDHCQSADAKPTRVAPPQVLVDLACSAVNKSPMQLVRNHNNEPVDASDTATVRFSVKP